MKNLLKHPIFLPLLLIAAIVIVVFLVKTKAPVEHQIVGYPIKAVEVITATKIPFRARAVAYGNVEPAVVLNTKSEVSGKISFMHADLQKGASLAKDTLVLRIEPTTFEISLTESMAVLANSRSALVQLAVEEKSTRESLNIVQKNLDVEAKELERTQELWEKRIISLSTLDKAKQKVLSLQQQLQDIEGKLAAFASRRASINAQIKQSKSQVDKSQDTLGRTEVRLPFDARIGVVAVEKDEFVQAGSVLFEALGVEAVEIIAQIPTRQFRPLVTGLRFNKESINLQNPSRLQAALSNMQLEARVRLVGNESDTYWQATLLRLSASVDPIRDTLSLVVIVDKPYENIIPGKRPPLLKGMFTSVELLAPAKPTLVLPRKAVHQGRVYIATEENKLAIRPVNVLFTQGELVVIADTEDAGMQVAGIQAGEKLIISDVIPVIEGLPLKTIIANDYEKQLRLMALGNAELHGLTIEESLMDNASTSNNSGNNL
jgi:multidrug efflux pump subunit AcrA (membrane-fusion protein)